MISFDQVSVRYEGAAAPTLSEVSFTVPEGDLCLVVGPTGSGKSTLLGAACGLVPHFSGGRLDGTVTVAGRDTRDHHPRDLADVVGVVGQNPVAGFVTGTVEEELAFTMEQLALPPDVMRTRVEETLDLLGLAELRGRRLDHLSGGQQQRVAIGAVLTAHPRVLILDEPTSALDPTAAEEVLATLSRLVADLGVTVLLAEHRLERIVQFADRVLELTPGQRPAAAWNPGPDGHTETPRSANVGQGVRDGTPSQMMRNAAVAPPIVELGRLAGWDPLPLSIRDARRQAGDLRRRLDSRSPSTPGSAGGGPAQPAPGPVLQADGIQVRHGSVVAVRDASFCLARGSVTGLMGRNGAGKTSLLWALQGSGQRHRGALRVDGVDPAGLSAEDARRTTALVPQDPGDLLYYETVGQECAAADGHSRVAPGSCSALLDRLVPGIEASMHPRDLSEGQRLGLVLAIQLVAVPVVVALDEPTRGLDYATKGRLTAILQGLAASGTAVIVSSHDVEFVAGLCDRVLVMADGEIIADGPTAEVVTASPAFAPQVSKILAPGPWLTVHQVADALKTRCAASPESLETGLDGRASNSGRVPAPPAAARSAWPAPTPMARR